MKRVSTRVPSQPARRYRELLEAAPDAIVEVDQEGRITLLNSMVEQLFGFSREELLGQPVEILVPESLRAGHIRHRDHYHEHPSTRPMGRQLELKAQRKDGVCFPVEISLSPSLSPRGFRVTAILRDVSERTRMQRELRQVQEQLTEELRLRVAESERANQLKSEFLANMSHELRTPLHTIIGFSELLAEQLEGPLNDKQQRFVRHIHRDSLHLLQLINDVLDISKIEAGRVELRPETLDLAEASEEVLFSLKQQAAAKPVTLHAGPGLPITIRADRLRLTQILYNLLSNAVKFTPAGGSVSLDAAVRLGFCEISVEDTGIGIPASEQELVFDKFYQVRSPRREGTGLGLAITKRLVEQHGGRIWLHSEPNHGSRFTFTLPLDDAAACVS